MDSAEDWRVVEAERGRKMFYNIKNGISTFEKPNALKTMAELQRDENIRNGKYDEIDDWVNAESSEPATSNMGASIGYEMLKKQGWNETSGLGKSQQGITAPISVQASERGVGLGSSSLEEPTEILEGCERPKLTAEQVDLNLEKCSEEAKRQEALQDDIKNMNKEFYCEICDKQYKNVAEMANHLSSYDHHHKKRFKEMRAATKRDFDQSDEATESKRRKESRREEKQLAARMQMAQQALEVQLQEEATKNIATNDAPSSSMSSNDTKEAAPIVIKFGLKKKK